MKLRITLLLFSSYLLCFSLHATSVAVSIPPLKFIFEELLPKDVRVDVLMPPGASPHFFEPGSNSAKAAEKAALIIYISKNFDGWVAKLGGKKGQSSLELAALIDKSFELRQDSHHGHAHHGHSHGDHGDIDPHIWMDPLLIKNIVEKSETSLCAQLAPQCDQIKARIVDFSRRLKALDETVKSKIHEIENKNFFMTHNFLAYFSNRYGLHPVQSVEPIPGKEPSAKDIAQMIRLAKEKKIKVIFTEPELPMHPIRKISEEAKLSMVQLDPLGTDANVKNYQDLILKNVELLVGALSGKLDRSN